MRGARAFLVLSASVLIGVGFSACGGRVAGDASGDAGVDASPTATTTTTTPPTGTVKPASCPTFRPINGTPCTVGLSCFYSCSPTVTTAISAACPAGTWRTTVVESCEKPPPPPPEDCESCVSSSCIAEIDACEASDTALKGCQDLIECLNGCANSECQNRCIADSKSTEGKSFISCIVNKCSDACGF